jgi:ubiquinol-cytochrome c reductase iron-sulfur subunit
MVCESPRGLPGGAAGKVYRGRVVMADATVDTGKRRFLVGATSVVGAVGVAGTATPFVMSMFPSERARAAGAPVEVDIDKLEVGQKIDVEWRGKVVWIINRTNAMLETLPKLDPKLADPNSNDSQQPLNAKNEHRSIKDNVLVMVGICTHLGCSPTYRPEVAPADLGPDWPPTNMPVPPYRYVTDTRIVIGEEAKSA